jgi:hypothetical protein
MLIAPNSVPVDQLFGEMISLAAGFGKGESYPTYPTYPIQDEPEAGACF